MEPQRWLIQIYHKSQGSSNRLFPLANGAGEQLRSAVFIKAGQGAGLSKSAAAPAFLYPALENNEDAPLGGMGAESPYSDHVDKSHLELDGLPWPACAKWALGGQCENGHQFWKVLMCGLEWCPDCGADGSWIHNRRIARWLPKIEQLDGYGYWVIEWPLSSRDKLRSKEALSETGKQVKGAMVAMGYDEGLRRWHWFGDKDPARLGWNPHLNLITPGGRLQKRHLEKVKGYLRYVLNEPNLIVHYSFRQTTSEMMHGLRYITRATFRDKTWDPAMVEVVSGFHNSQTWGRWDGEQVWGLDEDRQAVALEAGKCPICGEPITWDRKVVSIAWLGRLHELGILIDMGAGYFYQGQGPPPEHITDQPDKDGLAAVCRANVNEARNVYEAKWLDKELERIEDVAYWLEELERLESHAK